MQPLVEDSEWSQEAATNHGQVFVCQVVNLGVLNTFLPLVVPGRIGCVGISTLKFQFAFNEHFVAKRDEYDRSEGRQELLLARLKIGSKAYEASEQWSATFRFFVLRSSLRGRRDREEQNQCSAEAKPLHDSVPPCRK